MARRTELGFPKPVVDYAALFLSMYKSRCKADYDPSGEGDFKVRQALNKIGEVEVAIHRFDAVDQDDRRAFAVLIAVKKVRNDNR